MDMLIVSKIKRSNFSRILLVIIVIDLISCYPPVNPVNSRMGDNLGNQQGPPKQLNQYENPKKIKKMKEALRKTIRNKVIFFGSYSLTKWRDEHRTFFQKHKYLLTFYSINREYVLNSLIEIVKARPKAIVLLTDIFDENFDLEKIFKIFANRRELAPKTKTKIIICSIFPIGFKEHNEKNIRIGIKVKKMNKRLRWLCFLKGFKYVDVFSKLKDKQNYLDKRYENKGLLNLKGYKVIEKIIVDKIKRIK